MFEEDVTLIQISFSLQVFVAAMEFHADKHMNAQMTVQFKAMKITFYISKLFMKGTVCTGHMFTLLYELAFFSVIRLEFYIFYSAFHLGSTLSFW